MRGRAVVVSAWPSRAAQSSLVAPLVEGLVSCSVSPPEEAVAEVRLAGTWIVSTWTSCGEPLDPGSTIFAVAVCAGSCTSTVTICGAWSVVETAAWAGVRCPTLDESLDERRRPRFAPAAIAPATKIMATAPATAKPVRRSIDTTPFGSMVRLRAARKTLDQWTLKIGERRPQRAHRNGREHEVVKVLLVEDDDAIAEPLAQRLEREGYKVRRARSGEQALAAPIPDLVLLDLRLPDIDGTEVCRRLRRRSNVPIIVVSARQEETDRVVGLELGADDYVVKPFGFRELLARIRAVMRRAGRGVEPDGELIAGGLTLDRRARLAALNGELVRLTAKEFEVLAVLMEDPGRAVTRRRIFETVWGSHWYGPTKTLDVHVASIRRKLGDARWIETVRGVGFRLNEPT